MRRLWLLQAIGNALLFWCAFVWLGIRDSKALQLTETAVLGLLILVPWLWLQNGTLAYCGDRSQGLWPAFRKSLRTLVLFTVITVVFVVLFWALGKLEAPLAKAGQQTASWLTFHLRKPIKPVTWARSYLAILWGVRWILLPVLALPIAAGAALHGARGMWRRASSIFWLEYLIALGIGFYVPSVLMGWVPKLSGTTAQVLSLVLRFGVAYALVITTWIAVAFFSSETKSRP